MSEGLRKAIAKALGDDGTARPFSASVEDLVRITGSGRAAARAIGVDEKTLRRWRSGETRAPKAFNVQALGKAARGVRVRQREPRPADFVVKAKDRQDGRERTLKGDTNLRLSQEGVERVKAAYVAGDDARAEREFLDAIGETEFYRDWLDESRYEDRWGSDYGAVVTG